MSYEINFYELSLLDQEYSDLVNESLNLEGLIGTEMAALVSEVSRDAAGEITKEVTDFWDARSKVLANQFFELSQVKVKMLVVLQEAINSGQSINGYSPEQLMAQMETRRATFEGLSSLFQNSLDNNFDVIDAQRNIAVSLRVLEVFGEVAGPAYDTLQVLKKFDDGSDYGAMSTTVAGIASVIATGVVATFFSGLTLPASIGVGVVTGVLAEGVSVGLEVLLTRYDVLDIDELTPDATNVEGIKRLNDVYEIITALGDGIDEVSSQEMLDASSGVNGEHIESFFQSVKNYFQNGDMFSSLEELASALRQAKFENGNVGPGLINLTNYSSSQLIEIASKDNDFGRSVRYAMENL